MSNLFKKVTAGVAAAAVAFSVVSPVVGVSADSAAADAAAALAAAGVITAQTSEAGYKLDSTISRREMLKVMMNLSTVEVTDACEGKFSDLPASDWGCKYAEAALKAGFIAPNATFRPAAAVTAAEALKMIMQAKGIEKAAGVTDWAQAYLQAALEAGVVAEGTTLAAGPAKRSTVFTMASTALTTSDSSDEDDLDLDLGDLIGGEDDDMDGSDETSTGNTSTDGSTPVVVGGDVEISLNPASPSNGTQIPNNGTIRFAKVDFTAGDKDVSLNTVELKSVGLAAVESSTRVWFEKNGKRLSGKAAFSSDRTAVVSFAPAYVVKAGSTETFDLYVELAVTAGNDYQFSGAITSSSAANAKGSFVTSVLRSATYTVAPVTFNVSGAGTEYNQSNDLVELGRFTLENKDTSSETRDVLFQNLTLRQNGNGDLLDLTDLQVERSGVKISTEVTTNGKDVTFVLNDTVKDSTTAIYYIKAKVANVENNGGDEYQFSLRNSTDLNAVEVLNGYRSTVTRSNTPNAEGLLNEYVVKGSDLKFERDSSIELSRNYAKGTNNVVLMQGTITTKSSITLEDPELGFSISGGYKANDLFDTVYLQIGSSTMTWTANTGSTAQFLGLATVNSSAPVKVYAKLRDTAPQSTFKFEDLRLTSFDKVEYVSNQNTVLSAVGTVSAVTVSVDSTGLSVTRVDGLGDTRAAVGSKAVTVNGLNLVVNQGNDVQISNAEYTISTNNTGSTNGTGVLNNAFATLYVDGTAVSTKTINASTVKFDGLSKIVGKTAVNLTVKVDFSDSFASGTFAMKLTGLSAIDTLTSANVFQSNSLSAPSSAIFTIADAKGTLSASDNNPKASLLLAGEKDQKVLAFRVKAENDTIKLRDLVFTGTTLGNLSNFRLLTPTNKYISATSNTATEVRFTNINPEDSIVMDRTETYYLVADINTNVDATFSVVLNETGTQIKGSNGSVKTVDVASVDVASNVHKIAENKVVIAKSSNSSKLLINSALRFSVTASGKDQVSLSGANLTLDMYGVSGTGVVKIYKDSISASNLVGTYDNSTNGVAVGSQTFAVNLNQNNKNTVDAGNTSTYIVAVEGVTEGGVANVTPTWTIKLNDVTIGTSTVYSAKDYNNVGEFPITETR